MKKIRILSKSQQETKDFGEKFASSIKAGDIICLFGDLGSGKTTLVKGLAKGLHISPKKVHSPTFTLMNVYEGRKSFPIFHFDLYRIEDTNEIFSLDYEEYLFGDGVAIIEWAEKLENLMPKNYYSFELKHKSENERSITVTKKEKR
ncbi:MAG: tRNA (adenosine(37)-N6)-threonylcarbamoyltransferase complex ATPase subunit type 1 TsaE [Candidatus Omnitrophica bacterium]|nr:tRNA (adenosine(37)-N6)-threonylcarbamoyltransferase complex ATPase subunit type 1 TsaE [Candidatus Omnitrophota bacterium]MBU1997007.1 tRNA (adenosine(37)-N6)-threonylcarbamoyltransferase complex ATPase subunit type 1 TsaE [Candidatus Omnitrophota bacterium]MBU4333674.1 tRNA (adenosine(37)-N6)-threonylcarbamoyltransferase complex ATPase subunit type 1 TsaE [Candidatus Omnitrophota bacterium]